MRFINNELMKTSFQDESQASMQSGNKSNVSECELEFYLEVTKESIHECLAERQEVQNDVYKSIVRRWEEF